MYTVIEDNREFLLIDKDPGVGFHKDREATGLTGALRAELGMNELFTVHRLDKMTSGLLLFAKNRDIAKELSKRFMKREVEKYYLAISDKKPKKTQGLIAGDIEKARRGARKLTRNMSHPALTQFFSCSMGEGLRLFLLRPYTGKTHQLRVSLKSIGAPVLGDEVYHRTEDWTFPPDRGYLHSYALKFILSGRECRFLRIPETGRLFRSEHFLNALHAYAQPWNLRWPALRFKNNTV